MRVRVDAEVCQGHTLCSLAAPDLFALREEDGHAFVLVPEVPAGREDAARKAMLTCPEGAISVE